MSASNYEYYGFLINSKTIKSAPRISVIIFAEMVRPLNKFRHSDIWICKWKRLLLSPQRTCVCFWTNGSSWKSSGQMFASAMSHGCLVVLACFTTPSPQGFISRRSTFWVPKAYGQTKRIPPFFPWNRLDCSFYFAHDCSQIAVNCYKDSSRRMPAILTACIFVGYPCCCIGCKPPSLLGLFIELLLHLFFPHPVLNSVRLVASAPPRTQPGIHQKSKTWYVSCRDEENSNDSCCDDGTLTAATFTDRFSPNSTSCFD